MFGFYKQNQCANLHASMILYIKYLTFALKRETIRSSTLLFKVLFLFVLSIFFLCDNVWSASGQIWVAINIFLLQYT